MIERTCSLPDCDKRLHAKAYCYAHYMKHWRYGTPTPKREPTWADVRGQRFGALVVLERRGSKWVCICDCGAETQVRAGDLNAGTTASCGNFAIHRRRNDIGYTAAHDRVRADRGPICNHSCVDCGRRAQHWSYDHTDPYELLVHGLSANPIAYSPRPEHYSPRCVKCHKRHDLDRLHATPLTLRAS